MAPKFKGKSKSAEDSWLDDEDSSHRGGVRKKSPSKKAQSGPIAAEEANATVAEVFPNQCRVETDEGVELLSFYKRSTVFKDNDLRERAPVAVGDRVQVEILPGGGEGLIRGVAARENCLMRPSPDREEHEVQVLAANIDILVIVASVHDPEFSPGLVDRFMVAAQAGGIKPVLCVNKIDLVSQPSPPWSIYLSLGIEVFEVSAKRDVGVQTLRERLTGHAVVFCGHSGVGKTSLLRALIGNYSGKVGEVSSSTGKGQHTTTSAIMLHGPKDSHWIDTPGIREFGLVGIKPATLKDYFREFSGLECNRRGCLHRGEQDCQATELPRYTSYRRILEAFDTD
jgi:ribosome biogenesis GTPase